MAPELEHFHSQLVEAEGLSPLVKKGYGVNMAFLQISLVRFKQRQIPPLLTNALRFCASFWVIFGNFGKDILFLKG